MSDNKLGDYITFGILALVAWFMFRAIPTDPPNYAEMDRLAYALAETKRDLTVAESHVHTADSALKLAQAVARRRVAESERRVSDALKAARDSSVTADSLRGHVVTLGVMVGGLVEAVDSLNAHVDTVRQAFWNERMYRITAQTVSDSVIAESQLALTQTECRIGRWRCPSRGTMLGIGVVLGVLIPLIR